MQNAALHNRPCQLYVASLRLNASLDHRAVLQETVDSACTLAGARYGVIAIRDDGQVVDCRLSGMTDGEEPKFCHQPGWMTFLVNIGRSAAPVSLDDFERCIDSLDLSEWRTGTENGHSAGFLLVPLLHRGVPVGHLYIGQKKGGGEFTQADGEILDTFAVQAAMAIENARMYRDEQRARADLAALVDASSAGLLVFDLNSGDLISANAEARRIVSFVGGPGRTIDQTLEVLALLPAGEPDISSQEIPLARVRTSGETVETAEMIVRVAGGVDLTALVKVRSIHSEQRGSASVVVTMQDLTPWQESALSRREFVSVLNHEMRMPLSTLKGAAATALDPAYPPDLTVSRWLFRIVDDEVNRLQGLLDSSNRAALVPVNVTPIDPKLAALAFAGHWNNETNPFPYPEEPQPGSIKVAVFDPDDHSLRRVGQILRENNYSPVLTGDPDELDALVQREMPAAVLVGLTRPDYRGHNITERLVTAIEAPVICLSGDRVEEITRAFNTGAEECLVKPILPGELLGRLSAVLHRSTPYEPSGLGRAYRCGELVINHEDRAVTVSGQPVALTPTEYFLLEELSLNAGRVVTHDQLMGKIWGSQYTPRSRPLRSFIRQLREKLGDDAADPSYIFTEHRVGYRMAASDYPTPGD